MSSTNKTTHYQLSQYIGTDKPTYLADYNGDMSKIDTAIYSADTKAATATTQLETIGPQVTSNTNSINSLDTDMELVKTTQATQGNALETLQTFMTNVTDENIKTGNLTIELGQNNNGVLNEQNLKYSQYEQYGLKITTIYGTVAFTPNGSDTIFDALRFKISEIPNLFTPGRTLNNVAIYQFSDNGGTNIGIGNISTSTGILSLNISLGVGNPTNTKAYITIQQCILG